MTAGEMSAALAAWKAQVEGNGRGWPTDAELLDLMVVGGELENQRLRKALMAFFEANASPVVKMVSGPWIQKIETIFNAKEMR